MLRRRSKALGIVILLAGGALVGPLSAQEPAWILVERARAAYERRDLTQAMDVLLDAVEIDNEYPEAEYWLGQVYQAQGQALLAEEQYRRSLDLALYLRVPEDRIVITYALAELLLDLGDERMAEAESLLAGIADEEGASRPDVIAREHRYMRVLTDEGLDELAFLYRDELTKSLKARRYLGELAWESGRYRSAALNSARSVLSMLSTASRRYRADHPEWRFDIDPVEDPQNPDRDVRYPGDADGTTDLLDRIYAEDGAASRWLDSEGLWSQLYLLASALYAEGYEETARSVWGLMIEADDGTGVEKPSERAGRWGRLALSQVREPFIPVGSLSP